MMVIQIPPLSSLNVYAFSVNWTAATRNWTPRCVVTCRRWPPKTDQAGPLVVHSHFHTKPGPVRSRPLVPSRLTCNQSSKKLRRRADKHLLHSTAQLLQLAFMHIQTTIPRTTDISLSLSTRNKTHKPVQMLHRSSSLRIPIPRTVAFQSGSLLVVSARGTEINNGNKSAYSH